MKYRMITTFWYDEDDNGLVSRLERLFKIEFFQDTVLGPKSVRLAPARKNLQHVLQPEIDQSSDVRFVVARGKKSLRGTLNITRNSAWSSSKFTSYLELAFSLSGNYKGDPFDDVQQIKDILLACAQVGPSPMGFVECLDESSEEQAANFETFRRIDSMAVPVTIEWVSALHKDVVERMGVDLADAATAAGVHAGQHGDYWWIILSEEPFSFLNESHAQRYQAMRDAVDLEAIHARFPRQ